MPGSSDGARLPGCLIELRLKSRRRRWTADKLRSRYGPETRVEKLIQLLDEVDEVVGLAVLGARANGRRLTLQVCLLSLTLLAILLPV